MPVIRMSFCLSFPKNGKRVAHGARVHSKRVRLYYSQCAKNPKTYIIGKDLRHKLDKANATSTSTQGKTRGLRELKREGGHHLIPSPTKFTVRPK